MTWVEFLAFAEDVTNYYGRKNFTNERQLDLWFQQVKHIPSEPLEWIKRHIFTELDSMPANFPKAIRRGWTDWQDAHPEKMTRAIDEIQCSAEGCESGWIFLVRSDGYGCVAACDQCAVRRKITTEGSPMLMNARDARAQGMSLRFVGGIG